MSKVFIIGFNKCGTTSLHHFLSVGGLNSIHWRAPKQGLHVAEVMFSNVSLRRPILHGLQQYDAFSDMMFLSPTIHLEANILFRDMHRECPDAKFILNTRNKANWIESRLRHQRGTFLNQCMACYHQSREEVIETWSWQWDVHHNDVRSYFKDNKSNFLDFHIEDDDIAKLISFMKGYLELSDKNWKRLNASR
jgi:hypothetical protein